MALELIARLEALQESYAEFIATPGNYNELSQEGKNRITDCKGSLDEAYFDVACEEISQADIHLSLKEGGPLTGYWTRGDYTTFFKELSDGDFCFVAQMEEPGEHKPEKKKTADKPKKGEGPFETLSPFPPKPEKAESCEHRTRSGVCTASQTPGKKKADKAQFAKGDTARYLPSGAFGVVVKVIGKSAHFQDTASGRLIKVKLADLKKI